MRLLALLGAICAGVPLAALSAEYAVDVIGADGSPIAGAVVYLEPANPGDFAALPAAPGVMDQIDQQFDPHILVVQRGAEVSFPNSDSIKHHVFSFSAAKTFEIKLYRDEGAESVVFDKQGEVELGCNVHDWMLGYIFVADTPFFGRTDGAGRSRIEAPDAEYLLGVWHPRIDAPESLITRRVNPDDVSLRITLDKPLLPEYVPSEAVEFDDYD